MSGKIFGIIRKDTKEYFHMFKGSEALWTKDKSKAWRETRLVASGQSALFISTCSDFVQRKPAFLGEL